MFRFRNIILVLFIAIINGNSNPLDILVQRIQKEDDVSTLCLFGNDKDQLNEVITNILNIPVMIFTSAPKDFHPHPNMSKNILLVTVFGDNENEQWYLNEIEKLLCLTARKFVVTICGSHADKLKRSFISLSAHKFTRIFGILGNQTFTYMRYATDKVQELPKHGPLPDAMQDLCGFNVRTNIQLDAPRTFAYRNKNGQRVIAGYAAEVFLGFIRKHNAIYTEILLNSSSEYDIPRVLKAITNDEIDISMNPYIQMPSIQLTYPLRFVRWTILIPHNEYINPNQYFTRPFSWSVWMTIAALLVYITILNFLIDFILRFKFHLWKSFSRTFCTFLSLSTERGIQNAFRFHAQVLLVTFILSNLYSVHLTSFLTVFIKAQQAYTLQDLIDYKIRLLVMDTEVVLIPLANIPQGFKNIVTGIPINELDKQRYSARNKSVAYAVPSDKAEYILSQQVNLYQPNFHISRDSMLDANFAFMLPKDSPFLDNLSRHVLRQRAMGLVVKWENDAIRQGVEAGILHMLEYKPKEPIAFDLMQLSFAWNCLGIGLTCASVVFLLEICVSRRLRYVCRKRKNK